MTSPTHRICREVVENENSRPLDLPTTTFRRGRIVQAAVMLSLRKGVVESSLARGSGRSGRAAISACPLRPRYALGRDGEPQSHRGRSLSTRAQEVVAGAVPLDARNISTGVLLHPYSRSMRLIGRQPFERATHRRLRDF